MKSIIFVLILFLGLSAQAHTSLVYSDINAEKTRYGENEKSNSIHFANNDEDAFSIGLVCGLTQTIWEDPNKLTINTFHNERMSGLLENCRDQIKAIDTAIKGGKKVDSIEIKISREMPSFHKTFQLNVVYKN